MGRAFGLALPFTLRYNIMAKRILKKQPSPVRPFNLIEHVQDRVASTSRYQERTGRKPKAMQMAFAKAISKRDSV